MRMLLLFIFAFINSSESDQQLYGECKLRTTVDCGEGSNGPDTNSGRSNLLAGAGLPGKRGQKGASGEKGSIGAKGDVGPKGLKGDSFSNYFIKHFLAQRFAYVCLVLWLTFKHKKLSMVN